jgi:hypothetical protein
MKVTLIVTGIVVALAIPAHAIECQLSKGARGYHRAWREIDGKVRITLAHAATCRHAGFNRIVLKISITFAHVSRFSAASDRAVTTRPDHPELLEA